MNASVRHVVRPSCSAVNRVPVAQSALRAKCGTCHQPLFYNSSYPEQTNHRVVPLASLDQELRVARHSLRELLAHRTHGSSPNDLDNLICMAVTLNRARRLNDLP
jgi:hypothetical protein